MTLGPLMIGIAATTLDAEERRLLALPQIGGVILFPRNFESPEQLSALTAEIHALRDPPLLIGVDQEGGRVQRFREPFTLLPPVSRLGEIYDQAPARARAFAETTGWLMASELRAVGVDLSFAPVLDVDAGLSGVIGDRAFHRSPAAVAELAGAYVRGMRAAGMAACGKHFPGHGGVTPDSHHELPVDPRGYAELELGDLVPFRRLIANDLAAVMTAHVAYPAVAPEPASFSRRWIGGILRSELGFQGCVVGDDLEMGGAAGFGSLDQRARAALGAGCDLLLLCNALHARAEVAAALSLPDPASSLRLARLHGEGGVSWRQLGASRQWRRAVEQVETYARGTPLELGFD